jgi:hypothetical protein
MRKSSIYWQVGGIVNYFLSINERCRYYFDTIFIMDHSCAERGIRNALLVNGAEGCARGIIVPSNGNAAIAAAYHGGFLGVPVSNSIRYQYC